MVVENRNRRGDHHEHAGTPTSSTHAAGLSDRARFWPGIVTLRPGARAVVTDSEQMEPIELPAGAVSLLMEILEAMAAGRGVTIIPENAELSTVQAAEVLNVSRPFLIKLLEDGAIPHRKVGKHRRVRMEDVMSYKAAIDTEREAALDQLAADAQEQDMGYRSK
jgi:excisionase family DNA binding protein